MAADRNNPGAGDPWAINAAGIQRTLEAAAFREAATTVRVVATTASEHWSGVAQVAFESSVAEALPELTMLADSLDATATALYTCAGEVARIKDEQEDLERRRAVLEEEREELTAKRDLYSAPAFGQPGEFIDIAGLGQTYERELEDLAPHLTQLDEEWEELVRRRARVDADFVGDLSGTDVRGNVSAFTSTYYGNTSPAQLLLLLSGMSAADLSVLEAVHPEVLDRIRQAPPEDVAAWWAGVDSAGQDRLVQKLPTLIGSLGGIPPIGRVAANRFIAQDRLATVDAEIAELSALKESGRRATPGAYQDELARLAQERTYLQRAIDGKVQLYLYQPDQGNIIEMIGTPGPATTTTVTYTPGTFTSPHEFYADDGVQQVSRWLTDNDPGIVAFVWKQGDFPGEDPATGRADLFRIGEANEQQRALKAGELLHQFQTDLHASSSSIATASTSPSATPGGLQPSRDPKWQVPTTIRCTHLPAHGCRKSGKSRMEPATTTGPTRTLSPWRKTPASSAAERYRT